jgi:hypothetical protein
MQLSYTWQKKCDILVEIYTFFFRLVDWNTCIYCSHEGYQNLVVVSIHCDYWMWNWIILRNWLKSSWFSLFWRTDDSSQFLCYFWVIFIFFQLLDAKCCPVQTWLPANHMVPIKTHITVFPLLGHVAWSKVNNVLYIRDIVLFNFVYTWGMFSIADEYVWLLCYLM